MPAAPRLQADLPAVADLLQGEFPQAHWLVLAGRLPEPELLELIAAARRAGLAVLLVEPDPLRLEQLRQELHAPALEGVSLAAELLAAEAGEQCWYRYNDPRHSGTTPPELLQRLLPNLQLESLELRPVRPLAEVLERWQELRSSDGGLMGDGLLLVAGDGAAAVLAGAGPWLGRLAAVLVASAADPADELEPLLAAGCLAPEASTATGQLWRRSPLLLLQRQRDQLVAERDVLVAERDGLAAQRDGLTAKRDQLVAERDQLAAQRQELEQKLAMVNTEVDEILAFLEAAELEPPAAPEPEASQAPEPVADPDSAPGEPSE